MKLFYIIYLSIKEDGNVIFSSPYSSFNSAKQNIESFLNEYAEKRGKKVIYKTKDEFEKLKLVKRPDDVFYVRKKNSEAVIYYRQTVTGTFYNSFIVEKYGRIGINEFSCDEETPNHVIQNEVVIQKKEEKETMAHGMHVTFISELKNALNKRKDKEPEFSITPKFIDNPFLDSLVERKNSLKIITPPPERKLIL